MPSELKPCPFCGGPGELHSARSDKRRPSIVICGSCEASGAEGSAGSSAINAWNTRAEDKRIAALQSQLKEAKEGWDSAIADLYAAAEIAKGMQSQLDAKWISVDVSMPSEIDAEFWVWVRPNAGIRHDGSLIKADFSPHMRLCKTYQNRDGEVRFNCGALEEVTHYQRTPSPPPSGAKGETKP